MIHVDESDPVGEIELCFPSRDVTIKRGVDAKEIYELVTEIGRGKFGTVYKCKEKSTGLELAAKFVPIPKREDRRNVEREVEIMNSLQHSLIIQLYDALEYQKMMCVVLELIVGGELFDRVIDDDFILTEKACIVFIRQVCQAMEFVHRSNILHLDLKPENILCLTREGNRIKIIDFGLARKYDPDKKLQILFGTPEFVAPEVVNFDQISFGTDMWSVGVICYVLLSGLSPFMGATDIATMANVTIGKYDFDDEAFTRVSKDALDFIAKLLVKESSNRMTASECIEHIWLKRRAKPQAPQKQTVVPAPKLKTPPPTQLDEELKTTKDNLKSFIERWEEHPNSPYVFDTGSNRISPVTVGDIKRNGGSGFSSRGCSPSPCGSISSIPDNEVFAPNNNEFIDKPQLNRQKSELFQTSESGHKKLFKEYLQSFERRHSDSNCLLNRSSSREKINLAAEIKKLSDRLMVLSSINTDLSDYNDKISNGSTVKTNTATNSHPSSSVGKETNSTKKSEVKDKSETIKTTKKPKLGECYSKTVGSNDISNKATKTSTTKKSSTTLTTKSSISSSSKKIENGLSERLKMLDETPNLAQKLEETRKMCEKTSINRNSSFGGTSKTPLTNTSCTPWPITNKRTKFRITQLSRDVPIDSPNTHQPVFLEEAVNNTKDCLLHLLEKYNETETRSLGSIGRHQSISDGYGISDSLEYRSMNSLNHFFQRHANAGTTVKQIQAQIEAKRKS